MNVTITTASKQEEKSFESDAAVYVITSEDIRRSGATAIPEVLRMAPGVQVARIDSDKWAVSIRGFNDRFSDKLLVLVDGRSAYVPLFSGVYWNSIDYLLHDIDRIEVIRGSGGAVWGANAVNGVINIITKHAKDTQGGYVSLTHGNVEKFIAETRYGGTTKAGDHYSIYAKSARRGDMKNLADNTDSSDDWEMNRVGFKYNKNIKQSEDSLSIQGDIYDGKSNQLYYFPKDVTQEVSSEADIIGGNIVTKYNKVFSDDSKLDVQFYIDYDSRNITYLDRSNRTIDIDIQHYYRYHSQNELLYGFEYRNVHDNLRKNSIDGVEYLVFDPDKLTFEIADFFFQNKTEILPKKLFFTLGSKFSYNDFTHFSVQPTARLSYFPKENHHIWGAISKSVRTPTRWEDGMTRVTSVNGANLGTLSGNKQYDDEETVSYEIGYKAQPMDRFLFDVTAFYNDYKNLRNLLYSSCSGEICTDIDNSEDGESYGGEITSNLDVNDQLRLAISYSFMRLIMTDGGAEYAENRVPRNQVSLKSYYSISRNLQWDNILYFVDNLTDTSRSVDVDAYTRLDTRIAYSINDNMAVSLVGQNLTDHYHQEFGASLYSKTREIGRSIFAKVEYEF